MTDQPTGDFDGCNSEGRKAGKHSLRWGGCEHATPPEPTVSMSVVYTDPTDGYPAIGFDTYTVPQLAELIEPALNATALRAWRKPSEVAAEVARAIVHRHDEVRVPVVPVSSSLPDQTAVDRIAAAPTVTANPDGGVILHLPEITYLDTQVWSVDVGLTDAGLRSLADAVLTELPEFAEAHRLALSMALGLGTGAPWDAIHDRATELGLPPLAEDPVAQRLGLVPPSVDQAAILRDRIAAALHMQLPGCTHDEHGADCLALADAVLAVLPPPAARTSAVTIVEGLQTVSHNANESTARHDSASAAGQNLAFVPPPADRSAVLREAADRIDGTRDPFPIAVQNGITWATAELRRMAAECPQCGSTGACNGGPCPLRRLAAEAQPERSDVGTEFVRQIDSAQDDISRAHAEGEHAFCGDESDDTDLTEPAVPESAADTEAPQPETETRCPHGCDVSHCPCLACEADGIEKTQPTPEEIVRAHVTTLHLIGEQLADVESWMWDHLADVRDAERSPVQHAPGVAVCCLDCRAKGHAVCMPAVPESAADTGEETDQSLLRDCECGGSIPHPDCPVHSDQRAVCVCGHTRGEHVRVSGRLLCDVCDPESTDNLVCKEFEAL